MAFFISILRIFPHPKHFRHNLWQAAAEFQKMNVVRFLIVLLFICMSASAQVSVTVKGAPAWSKPTKERYYYLPDIETYYDRHSGEYIFLNDGYWTRGKKLPTAYRSYDLKRARSVVIRNYHGGAPYVHYSTHRVKYVRSPKYYNPGRR